MVGIAGVGRACRHVLEGVVERRRDDDDGEEDNEDGEEYVSKRT